MADIDLDKLFNFHSIDKGDKVQTKESPSKDNELKTYEPARPAEDVPDQRTQADKSTLDTGITNFNNDSMDLNNFLPQDRQLVNHSEPQTKPLLDIKSTPNLPDTDFNAPLTDLEPPKPDLSDQGNNLNSNSDTSSDSGDGGTDIPSFDFFGLDETPETAEPTTVEVKDLTPDPNADPADLIEPDLMDNHEIQRAIQDYNKINNTVMKETPDIGIQFPVLKINLQSGENLTEREVLSIKHYLLKVDPDSKPDSHWITLTLGLPKEVTAKQATVVTNPDGTISTQDHQTEFGTPVGYVEPAVLNTLLAVLKHRTVLGYYDSQTQLTGSQILALS